MKNKKLERVLLSENDQLTKLNEIVLKAIEEEKLISQKLYEVEEKNPAFGSKIADKIAVFGGSWKFIIVFTTLLLVWMGTNIFLLTKPFDPFPFILLNLFLSALAAVQAPIIMMSQNRKEEKDRQRATSDYLVNLKAEIEVRNLHQKIDLLMSEQMQTLFEIQKMQLEVMEEIRGALKESIVNQELSK